ncbi:uncharacterized protein TNCV_2151311 [Trichonephila clavipes]|nr:uncharacterized protein TNCV_2151311 [Trichonephila clavipes]
MAYLGKGQREDLFVLVTELNLEFDKSMTIASLKDLIIGSENYDEELTKNMHSTIVEDRKAREKKQEEQKENLRIAAQREKSRIEEREEKLCIEHLRLDEQKRKDEFELKKLRIQTQSKLGADTSKGSDTKFLVKEVSKYIHRFDLKEDISLLPTEVSRIKVREPDDKANSYEHVKDLLLKRFKLTPEKFRQLFVTHQKAPERTWIVFYHKLNTYFNGLIDGLKIDTFDKLSDLIITDQLKRKTPFEFKEYYLDEWANMKDFKRTLKQKSNSPFVKKQEFKSTEKNRRYEAPGKFEYNRKDKKFLESTHYSKHYEAPVTKCESVQRYQYSAQKGGYWISDLLEQASISFTKEGVKFNKYETHAHLMQISAENLQEELDLRHVENRQIKKELEKLIQDYKPEKQHLPTSQ